MNRIIIIILLGLWSAGSSAGQSLDDYLQTAEVNHPGLQAKYKAYESALQRVEQARTLPDPRVSAGVFISPIETRVGPQRGRLSVSQMFPWFGTLDARAKVEAEKARAEYISYVDAREKLFREVRTAYYEIWETERLIALEEEYIDILNTYEELATTRLRTPDGRLANVYRVQMDVEESRTRLQLLRDKLEPLRYNFNNLTGRVPGSTVDLPAAPDMPALPEFVAGSGDTLALHPSVQKYLLMRSSAEAGTEVVNKNRMPQIGVGLDYILTGKRKDVDISDNGKDAFAPMVSLSVPIWTSSYDAAEKELELKQEQFVLMAEDRTLELDRNRAIVRYELLSELESIDLYRREISLADKTLELIISDYANNREDFEEILRLQQRILRYEEMAVKARKRYLVNYAKWQYLEFKS